MKTIDLNKKESYQKEENLSVVGSNINIFEPDEFLTEYTFLNFSEINISGHTIVDCHFKNSERLRFENCKFIRCSFENIGSFELKDTNISSSIFENLKYHSYVPKGLLRMQNGLINNCHFKNIELTGLSYLFYGFGSAWVENSKFEDIYTERSDKEIECNKETKGIFFKKIVDFAIIDTDSCSGIENNFFASQKDDV